MGFFFVNKFLQNNVTIDIQCKVCGKWYPLDSEVCPVCGMNCNGKKIGGDDYV